MSHEDKKFMRSFITVLAALVVVAFIAYFIADIVTGEKEQPAERQAKIEENIKPVGQVNVDSVPAASDPSEAAAAGPRSGEQVYNAACLSCHVAGVAGAPKVGDQAAWAERVAKGVDGLLATAISGINAMPAKGACADCSDEELRAAIEYMLSQSGY